MGAVIMLGTLFGLIVLIFGLVLRYDPEARRPSKREDVRPMTELTPLLKAAIAFAYIGGFTFVALGVYLSYPAAPPASAPPRVHLGHLVLVDRGSLRLGGVRTVPARHSSHAVLVAAEHDLGWPAGVGAPRLHRLLRPARGDRRSSRATVELEVPVAQADHAPERRPRRRLRLGTPVQRGHRGPARRLLLRPCDPRTRAVGRHQAPVPAVRRARDGRADDGLHLPPRANGSRRTHRHRRVGRFEGEEPSPVVLAVDRRLSSSSGTSCTSRSSRRTSSPRCRVW